VIENNHSKCLAPYRCKGEDIDYSTIERRSGEASQPTTTRSFTVTSVNDIERDPCFGWGLFLIRIDPSHLLTRMLDKGAFCP
jgi:hypothetical protein